MFIYCSGRQRDLTTCVTHFNESVLGLNRRRVFASSVSIIQRPANRYRFIDRSADPCCCNVQRSISVRQNGLDLKPIGVRVLSYSVDYYFRFDNSFQLLVFLRRKDQRSVN